MLRCSGSPSKASFSWGEKEHQYYVNHQEEIHCYLFSGTAVGRPLLKEVRDKSTAQLFTVCVPAWSQGGTLVPPWSMCP